jgi:type VI protein secretion system component Hcp
MRKIIYLFFVAALVFHCSMVNAQTQTFIKALNGGYTLNGGSIVQGHVNEIEALSYSQGEAGCQDVGCPPSTSDFSFLMSINPASVQFKKLLYTGILLTSVNVTLRKAGIDGFEYYKIRMEDVKITSVQESGSSEPPTFAISLQPARIAWQQRQQNADGSLGAKTAFGWDITQNIQWNYIFP